MKRILYSAALALLFLLQASAQTTTTWTGTIKDLSNAVVTSGAVTFTLKPSTDTTISGQARFTPATIVCSINASGLIKALDGVSSCVTTMNTALVPTGTYYNVCIQPYNITPGSCLNAYAINASQDLTTLAPTPGTSPNFSNFGGAITTTGITNTGNESTSGNNSIGGNLGVAGSVTTGSSIRVSSGTLAAAIALLPSGGQLIVDGMLTVPANVTLPANIGLRIEMGGGVNTTVGQSLTIAGPLDAGLYQIFYGLGSVYFYGGPGPEKVIPQWFGATGAGKASGFTCSSGSGILTLYPTVNPRNPFIAGDVVTVIGAGTAGADLTATVTTSNNQFNITVNPVCATTVTTPAAVYTEDDSTALEIWANSVRSGTITQLAGYTPSSATGKSKLYMPRGTYNTCHQSFMLWSGILLEGEQGQVSHGAIIQRCNFAQPSMKIAANNYDPSGNILTFGNGNNVISNIQFRDAWIVGTPGAGILSIPTVQFIPAANVHSDTNFRNIVCEALSQDCIRMGWQTTATGVVTSGSTSITIADPSPFCNQALLAHCSTIILVGAGVAGANLTAHILSGMPTSPIPVPTPVPITVTIDVATSTTVTNPIIYPAFDSYAPIYFDGGEADVSQDRTISVTGNATGFIFISRWEFYQVLGGCLYANSLRPVSLTVEDMPIQAFLGCGTTQSADTVRSKAIFWVDQSNSQTNDIIIHGAQFTRLVNGAIFGGNVHISGAHTVEIGRSKFYDTEGAGDQSKSVYVNNARYFFFNGNSVKHTSNATDWSTAPLSDIGIFHSTGIITAAQIHDNIFDNTTGLSLPQGLYSDTLLPSGSILSNAFMGIYTAPFNVNLAGIQSISNLQAQSEAGGATIATFGQITTTNPKQMIITNTPASNVIDLQGLQAGVSFNQDIRFQNSGGNVLMMGGFKVPVAGGAVPTANGFLAYDSTANQFVGGVNGSTQKLMQPNSPNTMGASGTLDLSAEASTGFRVPVAAGAAPTLSGSIAYDSTGNQFMVGVNGVASGMGTTAFPNNWLGTNTFTQPANKTGQASIVADSAAINTVETIIVKSGPLAANRLVAGTVIRAVLVGTNTSSVANTSTFNIRIGTAGTTADGIVASGVTSVSAVTGTNVPFRATLELTVRTVGAAATALGTLTVETTGGTGTGISVNPIQVILPTMTTFNTTTASNIIDVSYLSGAATTTSTFKSGFIEVVYQ